MEYVAGKTLDQVIPRQGLKLSEVLKYAIQIADALAKAHAAGIIHRDLKPGNIMVTDDGAGQGTRLRSGQTDRESQSGTKSRHGHDHLGRMKGRFWARPLICRRSRPRGRMWTPGRISSALGRCFTKWSQVGVPFKVTRKRR